MTDTTNVAHEDSFRQCSHVVVPIDLGESTPLLSAQAPTLAQSSITSSEERKLQTALALTGAFCLIEFFGGYLSGSLAITSDALHLLTDCTYLLISLMAVVVARLAVSEKMTFGYSRAEPIGAFVSLIMIWFLTGSLVISAVYRLFHPAPVKGPVMFVLGCAGLLFNIVLCLVLGEEHDHGHSRDQRQTTSSTHEHREPFTSPLSYWDLRGWVGAPVESLSMRAAYLHVLGDLLQSVAVIIVAAIVTLFPRANMADPICTLVFACIILHATRGLAVETFGILLQAVPSNISLRDVSARLLSIPSVQSLGDFHIWNITASCTALTVHLFKDMSVDDQKVLKQAQTILREEFGIEHTAIQLNCDDKLCCANESRPSHTCISLSHVLSDVSNV